MGCLVHCEGCCGRRYSGWCSRGRFIITAVHGPVDVLLPPHVGQMGISMGWSWQRPSLCVGRSHSTA